jgi:hypothetical protein
VVRTPAIAARLHILRKDLTFRNRLGFIPQPLGHLGVGFDRIAALYDWSPTLYQIH